MKKPEHTILKRKRECHHEEYGDTMSVYNDSRWEVPEGYPPRPHPHPGPHPGPVPPGPHPGPHPGPVPPGPHPGPCPPPPPGPHPGPVPPGPFPPGPVPPQPQPIEPVPVDPTRLKIGGGLRLDGDVLSVKVGNGTFPALTVDGNGLSADNLARKCEKQERKINELAEIIVDLKSQINKLKQAISPMAIGKALADAFGVFVMDDGKLALNVGDGLRNGEDGSVSVFAGTGLKFEDEKRLSVDNENTIRINDNSFGVNVDNDTLKVDEDGTIRAVADPDWEEYDAH